jgi:peroxisome-assembly ATPase
MLDPKSFTTPPNSMQTVDYRRVPRALSHVYHSPLDASVRQEMRKLFHALAGADDTQIERGRSLSSWGRAIVVPESSSANGGVAWFEFSDICGSKSPMSAADYLEITRTFPTIFVTEVPKMNLSSKDMVGIETISSHSSTFNHIVT